MSLLHTYLRIYSAILLGRFFQLVFAERIVLLCFSSSYLNCVLLDSSHATHLASFYFTLHRFCQCVLDLCDAGIFGSFILIIFCNTCCHHWVWYHQTTAFEFPAQVCSELAGLHRRQSFTLSELSTKLWLPCVWITFKAGPCSSMLSVDNHYTTLLISGLMARSVLFCSCSSVFAEF